MRILDFLKREKRNADPSWSALVNPGATSQSGQFVDAKSAESLTAVFACVQALSESTACLPLHVFARGDDGTRERADDTPLARVLRQPNDYQSGFAFRESMTAAVLMHGNAYARKDFNGAGELSALNPMKPNSVTAVRLESGRHAFDWTDDDGRVRRLLDHEVLHLADRTEPGSILGKSRITIAREELGVALAQREHGASVWKNGAFPAGVITSPPPPAGNLSLEQVAKIRQTWRDSHQGSRNGGSVPMLLSGMDYKALTPNLQDLQFIAGQRFSVEQVCRIYRVPPSLVQDLTHATYNGNVYELSAQFIRYSLQRWLTLWESAIHLQLLGPIARKRYHAEHSVEGLLRGASEQRAAFYASAIAAGWMDPEEVRRLENLPPRKVTTDA